MLIFFIHMVASLNYDSITDSKVNNLSLYEVAVADKGNIVHLRLVIRDFLGKTDLSDCLELRRKIRGETCTSENTTSITVVDTLWKNV